MHPLVVLPVSLCPCPMTIDTVAVLASLSGQFSRLQNSGWWPCQHFREAASLSLGIQMVGRVRGPLHCCPSGLSAPSGGFRDLPLVLCRFPLWRQGADTSSVAQDSCLLNLRVWVINSGPFLASSSACQLSSSTSFFFPESRSVDGLFLWFPSVSEFLLWPPPCLLSCLWIGTSVYRISS